MESYEVALEIEKKIKTLEEGRNLLEGLGNDKGLTKALYKKDVAIAIAKLIKGKTLFIDEESITKPPATVTKSLAEGVAWESELKMNQAETSYKAAVIKLDVLQTQINALQSINKHLSNM